MSEGREYLDYREDILDAAEKARQFVAEMDYESFAGDDKTAFAVARALEITGEATKGMPEEIRHRYPKVPWRSMAGMRDKLVHDYTRVNREVVWNTVKEDLPVLSDLIRNILAKQAD